MTYRIDINPADEGYLWYGTLRTREGKIPIRDFRAYDPGRYYWCALWSIIVGRGIIGLRFAVTSFQLIGTTLALVVVYDATQSWWLVIFSAILSSLWLFPRYKLFDSSWSMIVIWVAYALLNNPSSEFFFLAGLCVGLSAFIGINHTLYNLLAFIGLALWLWIKIPSESSIISTQWFLAGGLLGASPYLTMLLFVPEMFSAFLENKIYPIFRRKTTNLPLPIPTLWRESPPHIRHFDPKTQFVIRLLFLLIPLFYGGVLIFAFVADADQVQAHSLAIASAFVGIFYMHHAFSRADIAHLSQSIQPFLLGIIAVLPFHTIIGLGLTPLLMLGTFYGIVLPTNFFVKWRKYRIDYVSYTLNKEHLWLHQRQMNFLENVQQLAQQYMGPDENFFAVPTLVGLYAILDRESPMYDTYPVYPGSAKAQQVMLEAVKSDKVRLAIIRNFALDNRDNLKFENTYPRVWEYINNKFILLEAESSPTMYFFYKDDAHH